MPGLPRRGDHHGPRRFVPMPQLSVSHFNHGGHDFSGQEKASGDVVRVVWYVTSQKNGASALGLQRVLGLGICETART